MKKILSIDGGGIRGVIPALVLAEIEMRTGGNIADMFDLIAGTSTGGIISLVIARNEGHDVPLFSAQDIFDLYNERGREIFSRSPWKRISSIGGLADEKYPHEPLEQILTDYLADDPLGTALTHVLVTSYNIETRKPYFFKSWKEPGKSIRMSAAARATSAAPTYFEPAYLGSECVLVDGGVFVNNPAMCGYAEARRLFPAEHDFMVVSLGTGELIRPITYKEAKDWGLAEWAIPVLNIVFDGVSDAVDYQLSQILGDSHIRIQGRLDVANDDMDDASEANLAALKIEAERIIKANDYTLNGVCEKLIQS